MGRGRAIRAAILLAAALAAGGAREAGAEEAAALSAADRGQIARINAYLNSIRHLEGDFDQIDAAGGRRQGRFYLRRPWRMRFQYARPDPMLVVADGTWLIVQEQGAGGRADRYPLKSTPARFLLAPDIDLARDARIVRLRRQGQSVRLWLAAREEETPGLVQLRFHTAPALALAEWSVTDAQGQRTEVILSNLRHGRKASNALFQVDERDPFARGR